MMSHYFGLLAITFKDQAVNSNPFFVRIRDAIKIKYWWKNHSFHRICLTYRHISYFLEFLLFLAYPKLDFKVLQYNEMEILLEASEKLEFV